MAKVVVSQILSGWAWAWTFDLKTNSVGLKDVGWDAGQTSSSGIESFTKVSDFSAFSVIVWNVSGRADNLNTLGLSGVVFISPNTLDASSTDLDESLAERIRVNTFEFSVDILIGWAGFFEGNTFSVDGLFFTAETGDTKSSFEVPFSALGINVIASPGGLVEVSFSCAVQWGSFADSLVEVESN